MPRLRFATMLTVIAVLTPVLSGCGGPEPETAASSNPVSASSGFPATVQTAQGKVTIPARPTKIVTLDDPSLDVARSLGATVITAAPGQLKPGQPEPWLTSAYSGTYDAALINKDFSPNIEKIATHQPDLILTGALAIKPEAFKQLSQIAPVVGDVTPNDDWDARVRQIAAATGTSARVPGLLASLKQAYAAAGLDLKGVTYQWMRFDGSSSSFSPGNGSWLEGFGMKPGTKQDNSMRQRDVFSLENLDQLDADVVFVWNYGGDTKKVEADPRFRSLPSVRNKTFVWTDASLAYSVNTAGPNAIKWAIARTEATLKRAQNS